MIIEESFFYTRPGWATCLFAYVEENESYGLAMASIDLWLKENIDEDDYTFTNGDIEFKHSEDATLFMLRFS